MLAVVENTEERTETFADVLADLMTRYGVSASDVARAIDGSPSTVSTWRHGKKVPRDEAIRRLSAAYPHYSVHRLTAAAGRKAPAPLAPDARERLLEVFDQLTEDQQRLLEIQARAVAESNRQN